MKKTALLLAMVIACLFLLISGCQNQFTDEHDYLLVDEDAYQLPDGNTVSSWYDSDDRREIYRLGNGDDLLIVSEMRVDAGGLNSEAQKQIVDFYRQQTPIYDVAEYILLAYEEYSSISENASFETYLIDQDIIPSASNEKVVYFTTTIMLPTNQGEYGEYTVTHAFERMTGKAIDSWSLFSSSEDMVKAAFLDGCSTDVQFIDSLYAAFRPEYVRLYDDGYEVIIPCTEIEGYHEGSSTYSQFIIGGEYTAEILTVLNSWAVPEKIH